MSSRPAEPHDAIGDHTGREWEAFMSTRLSELAHANHDKDPDAYMPRHTAAGVDEGRP